MAYEEKMRMPAKAHHIIMEERSKLSITVASFDEDEIVMRTSQGDLIVRGSGLHIGKLTLDSGEVAIDGLVTELCYEETSHGGSLWSRLFG